MEPKVRIFQIIFEMWNFMIVWGITNSGEFLLNPPQLSRRLNRYSIRLTFLPETLPNCHKRFTISLLEIHWLSVSGVAFPFSRDFEISWSSLLLVILSGSVAQVCGSGRTWRTAPLVKDSVQQTRRALVSWDSHSFRLPGCIQSICWGLDCNFHFNNSSSRLLIIRVAKTNSSQFPKKGATKKFSITMNLERNLQIASYFWYLCWIARSKSILRAEAHTDSVYLQEFRVRVWFNTIRHQKQFSNEENETSAESEGGFKSCQWGRRRRTASSWPPWPRYPNRGRSTSPPSSLLIKLNKFWSLSMEQGSSQCINFLGSSFIVLTSSSPRSNIGPTAELCFRISAQKYFGHNSKEIL